MLKRIVVARSNLNSAVYEPTTGQVIIVSGRRADRSSLFVFDPRQERVSAAHELDVKKIDPLLVKGDGSFFLPMRDEGKVARLSASSFEVLDSWQFDDLTLVRQEDADHYAVLGSVGTLPMAYNMAFDPQSRKVYLPAMDFTLPASATGEPKADPIFHAGTFSVTTLAP